MCTKFSYYSLHEQRIWNKLLFRLCLDLRGCRGNYWSQIQWNVIYFKPNDRGERLRKKFFIWRCQYVHFLFNKYIKITIPFWNIFPTKNSIIYLYTLISINPSPHINKNIKNNVFTTNHFKNPVCTVRYDTSKNILATLELEVWEKRK